MPILVSQVRWIILSSRRISSHRSLRIIVKHSTSLNSTLSVSGWHICSWAHTWTSSTRSSIRKVILEPFITVNFKIFVLIGAVSYLCKYSLRRCRFAWPYRYRISFISRLSFTISPLFLILTKQFLDDSYSVRRLSARIYIYTYWMVIKTRVLSLTCTCSRLNLFSQLRILLPTILLSHRVIASFISFPLPSLIVKFSGLLMNSRTFVDYSSFLRSDLFRHVKKVWRLVKISVLHYSLRR